jgi:hypothetical protein
MAWGTVELEPEVRDCIAPSRRIILLTMFTKTRMREDREVERARRALARCIAQAHTLEEEDDEWAG